MILEELNESKEELNQLRVFKKKYCFFKKIYKLIIDDNTKKNRELQVKIGKLEMECRVAKKSAKDVIFKIYYFYYFRNRRKGKE